MSNPYEPSRPVPQPFQPAGQGDATGGLIPYKNGPALTAYYLGILSLVCCPLGAVAMVLGILGLKKRAQQPEVKGSVHAWIGIVLGGLSTFAMIAIMVAFIVAALAKQSRVP